jgi:hypothetical protein
MMKVNLGGYRFLNYLSISVAIALVSTPAQAVTFKFQNIFPTSTTSELSGDPFVNNFSVDVTDVGGGKVLFQILNSSTQGTIGSVHFENTGNLLSKITLNVGNIGKVNFASSKNGNLPQGNKIGFVDAFAAKFSGGGFQRVNNGESLGIRFNGNFNSVISALQSEDLQIGIHVQELPQGQSDSFVSDGGETQVPEPLTILGTSAALGFGLLFKKKGF